MAVPKVGTDTEFFFTDKTGGVISADKFLPSRSNPKPFYKNYGTIHFDGIQGEFNANHSHCRAYVMDKVREGVRTSLAVAEENDAEVYMFSSIPTPPSVLETASDEAVEFGCDIDFVSWLDGEENPMCVNPRKHFVRYAGTHIHLGKYGSSMDDILDPEFQIKLVKMLDVLVGNTMVMLDQFPQSAERRKVYGKAGTYRPKPYGVEYRVLGNFCMLHHSFLSLIFQMSRLAYNATKYNYDKVMDCVEEEDIINSINNNDAELAWQNYIKVKDILKGCSEFVTARSSYGGTYSVANLGTGDKNEPLRAFEFLCMIGLPEFITGDLKTDWNLKYIKKDPPYGDVSHHGNKARSWVTSYPYYFNKLGLTKEFKKFVRNHSDNEIYV